MPRRAGGSRGQSMEINTGVGKGFYIDEVFGGYVCVCVQFLVGSFLRWYLRGVRCE